MSVKYNQCNTFYLAGSGTTIGATSVSLTSLTNIYGVVLTMTDFGSTGYCTAEPDTINEEGFTFTGITANANGTYTLTGVKTILGSSPYTETSGLVRQHSGGTKVVVTDNVAFWNTFANKTNNETITGTWGTANVPSSGNDYVNKTYADGLAIAGAPDSSTTTKGIGKVSVAPALATAPIFVGDNDTRVPTIAQTASLVGNNTDIAVGSGNKMVTQTGLIHNAETFAVDGSGSTTAYTATLSPVPTSLTNGMTVRVKIGSANTTTTPTLNVNGLGAKTIVKYTNTALAAADISAGMYCTFTYDTTNTVWVMQNPVANVSSAPIYGLTGTTVSMNASNTSAAVTKIAEWTSLTGDADDIYMIDFELVGTQDSATGFVAIRLNDDSTANHYGYALSGLNTASTTAANTVSALAGTEYEFTVASASRGIGIVTGTIRIKASKTIAGTVRSLTSHVSASALNGTSQGMVVGAGTWSDTTTQITSVQLYYSQTSGSSSTVTGKASLYKINR